MTYSAVIFDLGGVLIDWNPEYLYRKIFSNDQETKQFLNEICHSDWNREQDRGRPFAEAVKERIATHPTYQEEIQAYHERWEEMLGGPIEDNVAVLEDLRAKPGIDLYAITNWSAETFPIAQRKYAFLNYFKDTVVSGELKIVKPDAQIYQTLLERQPINPKEAIFIDDVKENIQGAEAFGITGIHFTPDTDLREELTKLGVL